MFSGRNQQKSHLRGEPTCTAQVSTFSPLFFSSFWLRRNKKLSGLKLAPRQ